ncbi:Sirohydrochlorin cobaltochelatase [Bacteroides coprosuis DSM 18011]|uniref:Sirohydrochlorin cobaltochelatase n=1 Tax=Bacteroides coprosuis DSM 18011 TaxID=679937 RepID=F3ZUV9_9BACE|nr:sirohydrochlorin cobaltochelatase [Bacteroides coprosuis]EGJ71419.1 Sirohydrochlorin cobaltochelatase [Bacteroides coprosuis DSM 18011]
MNSIKKLFLIAICMVSSLALYAHGGGDYEHIDFFKDMKEADKAAVLMVHFGTTHNDTREKTIDAINLKVKEQFTNCDFYEAYTSRIIIKRLNERGIKKQNPLQVLTQLQKEGYTHILIQPTTIINGVEMESLRRNVLDIQDQFKDIRIGNPLLYEPEDYSNLIEIITKDIRKDQAFIFVGHGTSDPTTAQYAMMDYMLKAKGHDNCIIGTIEGYPSFDDALNQLKASPYKKVTLIPLMFVAGDHAKNDIAGDWKEDLEKEGYQVDVRVQGLGENPQIQNLYVKHLQFITTHKKRDIIDKKAVYEVTGEVMH